MFNNLFKIVYFVEFVLIFFVRKIYVSRYRNYKVLIDKKTKLDLILLGLNGIGMIIPIIYIFSTVLDFADYSHPEWMRWFGVIVFAFAIGLLWKSQADLGKNWTPTLAIRADHQLITTGVFKHIRHPMYLAHLLWAVAQVLILSNWIAGYSFLIVVIPLYLLRVKAEEDMLSKQFGDAYKKYQEKTGGLFPRLWR